MELAKARPAGLVVVLEISVVSCLRLNGGEIGGVRGVLNCAEFLDARN